jgi:uncharacterized protein with PQ loop repeat
VVEVFGWAGTVTGTTLGLPQVLRLLRTGRVDGLSMTAWQAMLVINLSWSAHGLTIGQAPQIVTSTLGLCSTVPILYLMARKLRRHFVLVLLPGLLAAAVLIGVDQIVGSAAFGAAAIIPAVVSNASQSLKLVRSPRLNGVSPLFLILAAVNQGLWLSWAHLVPDTGTIITATVTGLITVFNLTWWSLRRLGLRPFLAEGGDTRLLAGPTSDRHRSPSPEADAGRGGDHEPARSGDHEGEPGGREVQQHAAGQVGDAGHQPGAAVQVAERAALPSRRHRTLHVAAQRDIHGGDTETTGDLPRKGDGHGSGQSGREVAGAAERQPGDEHRQARQPRRAS